MHCFWLLVSIVVLDVAIAPPEPTAPASTEKIVPNASDLVQRAVDAMGGLDRLRTLVEEPYQVDQVRVGQPVHCVWDFRANGEFAIDVHRKDYKFTLARMTDIVWSRLVDRDRCEYVLRSDELEPLLEIRPWISATMPRIVARVLTQTMHQYDGKTRIGDEACHRIRAPLGGNQTCVLFLSDESDLPIAIETILGSDELTEPRRFLFSKWRFMNGLRLFTQVDTVDEEGRLTHVDRLTFAFGRVDETNFAIPEPVDAIRLLRDPDLEMKRAIGRMSSEEARQELLRVATARKYARGRGDAELRSRLARRFHLLMRHIHALTDE